MPLPRRHRALPVLGRKRKRVRRGGGTTRPPFLHTMLRQPAEGASRWRQGQAMAGGGGRGRKGGRQRQGLAAVMDRRIGLRWLLAEQLGRLIRTAAALDERPVRITRRWRDHRFEICVRIHVVREVVIMMVPRAAAAFVRRRRGPSMVMLSCSVADP